MAQREGGRQLENDLNAPSVEHYKRLFEDARDGNDQARSESLIDRDYWDGYHYTEEERKALEARKQPTTYYNEVRVAIRGLVGVWEQGETDPRAYPREPGDEDAADVASKVLRYVKDYSDWQEKRSYCALSYFVEGTAAVLVDVDDNGRVQISRIGFEEFFNDPRSRALDFSDARYMGCAKWRFADELAADYPHIKDSISGAMDGGAFGAGGDSFDDRPAGVATGWVDQRMRRVFVVEMYHKENGKWHRCLFWGGGVIEASISPFQDSNGKPTCPIKARSCYIDRENQRYGEVRDLRSPQDAINKRESKLLHLANSRQVQATDPDIAMATDPDQVRREAARPDGVLPPGWGIVPTTDMSSGQAMLLQSARGFMQRIGQNPGVLAAQSASASGRAQQMRQAAGMTDSAMTLGGLARFELTVFRACWERCKQFWTAPDYIRVTGDEQAAEFVGINQPQMGQQPQIVADAYGMPQMAMVPVVLGYKNALAEMNVDIEIDSVPDTANLAAEQFQALVDLARSGVQLPPKALIMASSLPDKRKVLEQMEQPDPMQEMQGQMAQVMAQLEQMQRQADIEKTQSETAENLAQAEAIGANLQLRAFDAGTRVGGLVA
jgi:hypothetical protein